MLHLLLSNMPVITMDALGTSNCYLLISFNTSRAGPTCTKRMLSSPSQNKTINFTRAIDRVYNFPLCLKKHFNVFFYYSIYSQGKILTLVNPTRERSMTFPAVIVNLFCDLNITNNRIRHSAGVMLYQSAS